MMWAVHLVLMTVIWMLTLNKKNNISKVIISISIIFIFVIIIFILKQNIELKLYSEELKKMISIYIKIFISLPVILFLKKSFFYIKNYVKAFSLCNIIFSFYILCVFLLKGGLSANRDTVLGFASLNYASAVLYLSFPLILYYLNSPKNYLQNDKNLILLAKISVIMSFFVFLLSGSRTTIVIATILIFSQILLKKENKQNKLNLLLFILAFIGFLFLAYFFIPPIHDIFERALGFINGSGKISEDVRMDVWNKTLYLFNKNCNTAFGTGNNMMPKIEFYPHNIFLEILMLSGYYGVAIFVTLLLVQIFYLYYNSDYYQKYYISILLLCNILTALFHPFYTTSINCGSILWCSAFLIKSQNLYSKSNVLFSKNNKGVI